MLQSIRDHTQGWIAGIIISLLILSFALWGIHSYFTGGPVNVPVAEVNGVPITNSALSVTYERLRRQVQTQDANYNLSAKTEAALKQHALQSLISVQVLQQASIKQGYAISEPQVDHFLESLPEFQVNGQFSLERFQQILATTLLSANEFINLIKTTLLIDQPRLGIIFTSFALPDEVTDSVALVKQKRDIRFTVLPLSYFANQSIVVPAQKITAYYQQKAAEFKTPEQVSVDYLLLSINDVIKHIQPNDNEIKNFYNENPNLFLTPTNQLAAFDTIKDKAKTVYLQQKAEEYFSDYREKLANLTYEHPETLTIAAKALGLPLQTSELFSLQKGGNDLSAQEKVREIAFSNEVLNLKNNSDVIQISPETVAVIRIQSHVAATQLPLAAVQNKITAELKIAEINNKTLQLANQIKQSLAKGNAAAPLSTLYHLTWRDVGFIERHSTQVDSAILEATFMMARPADNKKPSYAVVRVKDGYAIIELRAINNGVAGPNDYRVFAEQMQNTQGLLEYELYKLSLLKQAKIKIN